MDHIELGKQGEIMARELLKKKRYTILETNWRFEKLEVDIIARDADFLVFTEVKTRQTELFGDPASFISRRQQRHLSEAVEAYLYMYPERAGPVRYDVVSVVINQYRRSAEHIEDAFWPDNLNLFCMME